MNLAAHTYIALADAVLVLHLAVVVFVVGAVPVVLAGNRRGWGWVNGWPFRLLHLAAIAYVAAQSWVGIRCPLTVLENWLRSRGGAAGYTQGFVEHWAARLLYYDAPPWVFVAAYTGFAVLVMFVWWKYPPRRRPGRA